MGGSKEECFRDAAGQYEEATGRNLGLDHQRPWRQLGDGTWEQASSWQSAINTHITKSQQFRVPDVTVDGKTVIDLKFTRADGTVDTWGTRPGQINGNTQRQDYNDINSQGNPDFDNDDPKLDPESCNCRGGNASRVTVPVYVHDLDGMPYISASPVPNRAMAIQTPVASQLRGAMGRMGALGARPMGPVLRAPFLIP